MLIVYGLWLLPLLICAVEQEKYYESQDGSLFYIEREKRFNWYHAWNECARKNMTLIAIDSYAKYLQIDAVIRKSSKVWPELWIGGHDNAIDNRYEWAATGELFSFTNWEATNPKRGNNHCICIWSGQFDWHDSPCSTPLGFVCEENRFLKERRLQQEDNNSKGKNIQITAYLTNPVFQINTNNDTLLTPYLLGNETTVQQIYRRSDGAN